ncbi:MAG: hypothetical protein KAR20_28610, partial [Candidatus Heimdallarchaeota archaeon]|nr:hypothetical protein [Candidatus Heimdallarchaeota archaeon]
SKETENRKNILSVVLIVESSLEELGSFDITLKINTNNLKFNEFISEPNLPYEMKYNFDEKTGLLKIIGYNAKKIGKKGRFKIAHLYFENLVRNKPLGSQTGNLELEAGDAFSPLPEQKKIKPLFSLSLYEGFITG